MIRKIFLGLMAAVLTLHLSPLVAVAWAGAAMTEIRVIDRDRIMLRDVFAHVPADRDTVIGAAPAPGQDVVLNVRSLVRLASAYQVAYTPNSVMDQVTIRRDGQEISVDQISAVVQEAVAKEQTGPFQIQFTLAPQPIMTSRDRLATVLVQDLQITSDQRNFQAIVAVEGASIKPQKVMGKIIPLVSVWVPRESLSRGTVLSAHDFIEETLPIGAIHQGSVTDVTQLVGQQARRTLVAGRPVRDSDIEAPLLIQRGDKITLVYKMGGMELSAKGRSIEPGRAGERVRVVNTDSNKPLQGTVMADARVVID